MDWFATPPKSEHAKTTKDISPAACHESREGLCNQLRYPACRLDLLFIDHLRVYLSRFQMLMSQQLTHSVDIRIIGELESSEGVTGAMEGDLLLNPCFVYPVL